MRFLVLLLLTLSLKGTCKPIHDTQDREYGLEKRELPPIAQHGLTFGFSFAAIVAAAIGITEYATNFYHRYKNEKAQQEHLAWEDQFARQKKETDKRISTSAHDVVLDLVDKFVKKGKAGKGEETEDDEVVLDEVPTGDLIMLDSDEIVDVEPLPLPKLYGFPMQPKPVVQEEACALEEDCCPTVQGNHPSSEGEHWSGGEGYHSDLSDQAKVHPICRELKASQS
jgi:hypothetical protein